MENLSRFASYSRKQCVNLHYKTITNNKNNNNMATRTFKKNTAYRVYENGNFTSEVLTVKSSKRVLEDKGGYQVITYHITLTNGETTITDKMIPGAGYIAYFGNKMISADELA